ncbi:MAG: nucleotidyltransferase domain-containing protein [Opitutaceae bacterium]|nr:nucleotidyltransferase domain-containing protein [Opitutaceae bacterium]
MNANLISLTPFETEAIRTVLASHCGITRAVLFGSRAKGTHRPNSDVDLALEGSLEPLDVEQVTLDLDDLPLPYRFDLLLLDSIRSLPLREHIQRVGKVVYARDKL